jgi:sulfoxide reductase heme-binding subunit YedZ
MEKDLQTKIFEVFAKKSPLIIRLSLFTYLLIIGMIAVGHYLYFSDPTTQAPIYSLGKKCGQLVIGLLGMVVMPGILGRLGIEIMMTRIITLFRRQIGISIFLLSFAHYSFVKSLPSFYGGVLPLMNLVAFELMGLLAFIILFLMFLTSNNWGIRKLGKWWKRLHRFVYAVLWLLVLHTGLQKISIWSAGIFAVAVLEIVSLIYHHLKKRSLNQGIGGPVSGSNNGLG